MSELFSDPIYGGKPRNPGVGGDGPKNILDAYHNSRRLPQALVKIAGHIRSGAYLSDRIDYLTREGELVANNKDSPGLNSSELKEIANAWAEDEKGRAGNRLASHLILSSPKGTNVEALKAAVDSFRKKTFKDHASFFVIHTDTDYPHAHLIVRSRDIYGQKMHNQIGDIHDWRQDFAAELRAQGIEVAATSRASRGVTKKYRDRTADNAIKERGKRIKFDPDRELKSATKETIEKYSEHYKNMGTELLKSKNKNAKKMGAEIYAYSKSLSNQKTIKTPGVEKDRDNELEI